MAVNNPAAYGRDVRCVVDADPLMSEVVGLDVVVQDAIHRITTDAVRGPGGEDFGFDCTRLLGMPTGDLAALQPTIAEVLQRDTRIDTADVTLTATTTNGLADVIIKATCTTALGPFSFVKSVLELTAADLEGLNQ